MYCRSTQWQRTMRAFLRGGIIRRIGRRDGGNDDEITGLENDYEITGVSNANKITEMENDDKSTGVKPEP